MVRTSCAVLAAALLVAAGSAESASPLAPDEDPPASASWAAPADPLAAELERWSAFLASSTATDEISTGVRGAAAPALDAARKALGDGRRLLALQRLAAARAYLSALAYLALLPPAAREPAGFEAEWKRMGQELGDPLAPSLEGVWPAAVRAIGEAAVPQERVYHQASLEYGRSTSPESGLFYLGTAKAQREIAGLCRTLSSPAKGAPPPVRSLAGELDALEKALLLAYRPPASIERHADFIAASATLKEARELDAAGLRHGALLRYLQAAQRLAALGAGPDDGSASDIASSLRSFEARLPASRDDSVGQLFVEVAEADLASASAGKRPVQAAAIVRDVLPRYLAALEPPAVAAGKPPAKVTVTLVRWPYT